ncbi:phospho-N-acetylmuramoyl-pentapeptide-transferase [Luteipulveratus mongoliensis]|uniref:Phospho-N-acetylmuramoyl-pentapeptide-transferase n=1 Tax=Luteipulveratus mongoliensis TaxID=571913 RepID=A0A0K1JM48_9MICO|nr:phospho-N-acetylmuramoyl-pentapeptide-transferase [Luteipulveratus mongoliensis]AKU17784.1 phospho-N-acetylmuramoyl-pentapeptide-transferase [Luteipulveratus mongoliensis]
MKAVLLSGTLALVLSLLTTRLAIRQFTKWGYGQEIHEDLPSGHQTKRGTPTMGGVAIVLSVVVGYFTAKLLTMTAPTSSAYLLLLLFVGMAGVGFLDDYIKVVKQRSLGLRARAKMIGQAVIAVTFGVLALNPSMRNSDGVAPASHQLSFLRDFGPHLAGIVVIVLIWLMVNGTSNATNLTDGLDGLLAGSATMVFGAYLIIGVWQNNHRCHTAGVADSICYNVHAPLDLAAIAAAIAGACFGFLWWNASPARIIMGDTGSLAIGAAMAGFAIMSRTEMLLIVLGGLYVAITMSVMLQVTWFKATKRTSGVGKRLFRMAPLQHHFEILGWEQVTIVIRFWIITGLCVVAGLGIFYSEWVANL